MMCIYIFIVKVVRYLAMDQGIGHVENLLMMLLD